MKLRDTWRWALAIVLAGTPLGCRGGPSQPDPLPPPDPSPLSGFTPIRLSGVVYEVTPDGIRPSDGARILAMTVYVGSDPPLVTGPTGRFDFSGGLRDVTGRSSGNPIMSLAATKEGFSQPCRPAIDRWAQGSTDDVEVYLVADTLLSTAGTPSSMPIVPSVLSGRAVERSPSGERGVAGVRVSADFSAGYWGYVDASTVSDASGRFVLCGMSQPYASYVDEGGVGFPTGIVEIGYQRPGFLNRGVTIDVRGSASLELDVTP
jgi:hypothetical protein